ncbi:MAG: hypothetical protein ACI87O_001033 [Planctomycetota bacterium]|jgi:hypothetical protein
MTQLQLSQSVAEAEERLAKHPLYTSVLNLEGLQIFFQRHVICVLDFMSLLKSIEHEVIPRSMPWTPIANPRAGRLLHEIVLDEETEQLEDGRTMSHFEWYLEAMVEMGADPEPILGLVRDLQSGKDALQALRDSALPPESKAFGATTFSFLSEPLHIRAAVFFHGRENVIPRMFLPLAKNLRDAGLPCSILVAYLEHHVIIDSGDHGPRASQLLTEFYAGDEQRRQKAEEAALIALAARSKLWDATLQAINAGAATLAPIV